MSTNSPARLGETLDQCTQRYGQPAGRDDFFSYLKDFQLSAEGHAFKAKSYDVTTFFLGHECHAIVFLTSFEKPKEQLKEEEKNLLRNSLGKFTKVHASQSPIGRRLHLIEPFSISQTNSNISETAFKFLTRFLLDADYPVSLFNGENGKFAVKFVGTRQEQNGPEPVNVLVCLTPQFMDFVDKADTAAEKHRRARRDKHLENIKSAADKETEGF